MQKDRIDELNEKLQKIKDAFETWKKSGLNEEVLVIYIKHKTGLSFRDVRRVLDSQQEFFNTLLKEEIVKKLGK